MSARILAHSCHASPFSSFRSATEIVTLELCYPRYIHSELMTHRHLSRNARSSRAVPTKTLIEEVRKDPVMPAFRANQKGMQPGDFLKEAAEAEAEWLLARAAAVNSAQRLSDMQVHKQWANRLLEPFSRIHVVATASLFWWGSFLALRDHPAAQDEIQELARNIRAMVETSRPTPIFPGAWHAPYVDGWMLKENENVLDWPRRSAARCARVSYKPFDTERTSPQKDLDLALSLIESHHWSPFEHVCTPGETTGNLPGWTQLRHILERQ